MSENNEYLEMFFAESEEYIMVLNDNILKLENNPDNTDMVNSMFRAAHSLKGMSATMQFDNLTELTHKLENMMDQIRNKQLKVTTEIIDLLFAGIDYIEETVKQIKENGNDELEFDEYLDELEAKLKEEPKKAEMESKKEKEDWQFLDLTGEESDTVNDNKKELDTVYSLNVKLSEDTQFKQVRASMIFKTASELGYVFKSVPNDENVEEAKLEENLIKMILVSKQESENIVEEFKNISDVDKVGIKRINTEIEEKGDKEKKQTKNDKSSSRFEVSSSVRVDIGKLDNLMNMIGELLINKTRLEALNIDSEGFKEVLPQLDRVTMDLHHTVMQIRMEPIGVMFNRFPRMIRDLSKESDKEIDFIMEGKETELDRSIIDELGDPLTHLLRNAVDHGIEKPEVRKENGKEETGTVNLRAYQKGSEIIIEVEDDGDGIDLDRLTQKAMDKELVEQSELDDMEKDEKLQLIFEPGLSTNEKVSSVSGRGVGMDVVKRTIENLDGDIHIKSEKGKGTKFVLSLPLTLAIQDALMVEIDQEVFAIPLNSISETLIIKAEEIKQVKSNDVIVLRDETIPLIDSRRSLNIEVGENDYTDKKEISVVIVKSGGKEVGLIVDELLYQQEIVIKSLSEYLGNVENISGATIIGDGEVALILDVRDIA